MQEKGIKNEKHSKCMGHYKRYDTHVEIPEAKEKKLGRSNM